MGYPRLYLNNEWSLGTGPFQRSNAAVDAKRDAAAGLERGGGFMPTMAYIAPHAHLYHQMEHVRGWGRRRRDHINNVAISALSALAERSYFRRKGYRVIDVPFDDPNVDTGKMIETVTNSHIVHIGGGLTSTFLYQIAKLPVPRYRSFGAFLHKLVSEDTLIGSGWSLGMCMWGNAEYAARIADRGCKDTNLAPVPDTQIAAMGIIPFAVMVPHRPTSASQQAEFDSRMFELRKDVQLPAEIMMLGLTGASGLVFENSMLSAYGDVINYGASGEATRLTGN